MYQVLIPHIPHVDVIKGNFVAGLPLIIFGLVFASPTVFLLLAIFQRKFEWPMLGLFLFTMVGLAIFAVGVRYASLRRVIRFDGERVSYDERTLFRHIAWSESLNRYQGVRAWTERRSGGKSGMSYYVHYIQLHHPERRRRILLYRSTVGINLRELQEHYCRVLNLPAITDYGREKSVRDSAELDKSVVELASEGRLTASLDILESVPNGAKIAYTDGQFRIDLPKSKTPVVFSMIWFIISVGVCYIGFAVPGAILFGIVGAIFLLVVIAIVVWNAISHTVLTISPEMIHSAYRTPWGEVGGFTVDLNEVESVVVGRRVKSEQEGLILETDSRTHVIGQGLPSPVLEWTRECIKAVISGQLTSKAVESPGKSDFA